MSQPLRIEDPKEFNLTTSRTENSRLWFVNNKKLEDDILGACAKYAETREAKLFAFVIQGNHPHAVAQFPKANRADFMRDLNGRTAFLAKKHITELERGKFWERRYACQALPRNQDVEEYFFYCALQPVKSGLVEKINQYPGYNSFHDAVSGFERKCKVVDWTAYNNAKRFNPQVSIVNYTKVYTLKYERLPGYEHLPQKEYKKLMYEKLERRRLAIVRERYALGLKFLGREALLRTKRGTKPHTTKQSTRTSKRPLVLTSCMKTKEEYLKRYFKTKERHQKAVAQVRAGDLAAPFPTGTYRPPSYVMRLVT